MMSYSGQFTVVDLFAGAGGFSLGFASAGFRVTHALEVDAWAAETYGANFPSTTLLVRDIQEISDAEIGATIQTTPTVLLGGPPCQGFSHSNVNNKDPKDPRNSLFRDYMRFVARLKPEVCLVENVKGLLTTKTDQGSLVIDVILREFEALNYTPEFRVLNAVEFGAPQFRERLFIVATRNSSAGVKFKWPIPTHVARTSTFQPVLFEGNSNIRPFVTLWDAIRDLPQITHEEYTGKETYLTPPSNSFQEAMRVNAPLVILNNEPMRHTRRIVDRYATIGFGQSEGDVRDVHLPRKRSASTQISSSVYHQNGRRQHPDRPCNTVVASSHSNFIHPFLNRNFTVRELARIQTFPDCFEFRGKRAVLSKKLSSRKGMMDEVYLDQRMQVGNAVPPMLAGALANAVLTYLLTISERGKNV